ncbi:hypothetical protein [Aeromonas veronii]|uniref:hypothetical protein n=1 Tax=Aeromonas veronii TaxID=654 RepID=UPI002B45FA0E|nr:hypothetical protein [Aeromonas veronii]
MITVNKFIKKMLSIFSNELKQQQKLERDIFNFLLVFSRFEFSLKTSGFLVKKKNGDTAEPNWDAFVKKYKTIFQVTDEINESFVYLTAKDSAPNRQALVISDEGCAHETLSTIWKPQNIDTNAPDLKKVTDSIRLIRNNLFHGGKYGDKSWSNIERTCLLIEHSINVMWVIVRLDNNIESYFEDFA